jgi:hypothetical protein
MLKMIRPGLAIFGILIAVILLPSASAAQDKAEMKTVSVYLLDVTNSMMGCSKCLISGPTDKVLPKVIKRIADEVKAAPKPMEVFVVPFAHNVIDFDGDGPFKPWRKFSITNEQDAKDFAEYLNPNKYGSLGPGETQVTSKLLPTYGSSKSEVKVWPGFEELCADRTYVNAALYSIINQGISLLREMTPDKVKTDAWRQYVSTHTHRMTVFTDSLNTMKTANFAHVVQSAGLHQNEMDGQFWMAKVYVEASNLDAKVSDSILEEEKVRGNSKSVLLCRLKELPSVSGMLDFDSYRLAFDEGLKDPSKYEDGEMTLDFPPIKITGNASRLSASVYDSDLVRWPKESGLKMVGAVSESPFANIQEDFSPRLFGVMEILSAGLTQTSAKLKIEAHGKKGGPKPMFLMSGASEIFLYLDLKLDPPNSTTTVAIIPPGGPNTATKGSNVWVLAPLPLRKVKDGLENGTVTLTGDKYLLPGSRVKVVFNNDALSVASSDGRSLRSGEMAEVGAYTISIEPPITPGSVTADLEFVFTDSHLVFEGGASSYKAQFKLEVGSDLPFYIVIAGGVAVFLFALGIIIIRFLIAPPKISTIGGRLVLVRRGERTVDEDHDLSGIQKPLFIVGKGPQCDWILEDKSLPHYAFVIELRKKENRLRVRKWDSEVEGVKINNNDLAETFIKDGDHIEIPGHEFVFHG